jgi:hypothetical protein
MLNAKMVDAHNSRHGGGSGGDDGSGGANPPAMATTIHCEAYHQAGQGPTPKGRLVYGLVVRQTSGGSTAPGGSGSAGAGGTNSSGGGIVQSGNACTTGLENFCRLIDSYVFLSVLQVCTPLWWVLSVILFAGGAVGFVLFVR